MPSISMRNLFTALAVSGALLASSAEGALAQDTDPELPACGPGQIPTPQAPCSPVWPNPVGATRECASYYSYQGATTCQDITVHATSYSNPLTVPTPGRLQYWNVECDLSQPVPFDRYCGEYVEGGPR